MAYDIELEVRELAARVSRDPTQPQLPAGIGDAEVRAFEKRTGITVPKSLREWLRFTNGPRIGIAGVLGICTPDPFDDIEHYYEDASRVAWRDRGWIPIAGDGFGNFYVVSTKARDGRGNPVLFIDCGRDPSTPAYVVASGVWQFLRFYFRKDLGQKGWPFNRDMVLLEDPALRDYVTVPRPWEADRR